MIKEKYDVQGMTCSACQSHVQKAVSKLDGVKDCNVNLITNDMVVEYDEKSLNPEIIVKAVVDAGYNASLEKDKETKDFASKVKNEDTIKKMKKRLIISIVFWIPLMIIAMSHMHTHMDKKTMLIYSFAQLALLIPIVIVNNNYFKNGFKSLIKRNPNMDSLVGLGSSAAILYGLYAIYKIINGEMDQDIYFESAGTILTLVTVGKYMETISKGKTGDAISKLINLAPKNAIIEKDNKEYEVPTENILKDDVVIIKPGSNIPVDGIIIEGTSSVDEASITGESMPVVKGVGDEVISGTVNKNGFLKIKATKVGEDTTLAQIIKLVEEASNSKAPISRLADKISGVFVPVVILIAIVSAIIWIILGQSFEFALSIGISVLVISCPCALGLATPLAIMVGTGKGAENGILIKSAEILEQIHKIDSVVFDKTGTITEGTPEVIEVVSNGEVSGEELLKIAYSIEKKSEHPIAEAIVKKAEKDNIGEYESIDDFESYSGKGLIAKVDKNKYFVGNIKLIEENNIKVGDFLEKAKSFSEEGKTPIYIADENEVLGIITIADKIKESSKEAILLLKDNNIDVSMITGDNNVVAHSVAKQLGIENVIAEVLPQDKEKEIDMLQKEGRKVAFVGDGINDSPALVRSDVGFAIGSGTDIAIESADVILIKNDLMDIVNAINLSKKTISNIKLSLFWAFFYNVIGIPVAAGVLYLKFGIKLTPMIGAAAMSLSSLCVVTNALRLNKFKPYKKMDKGDNKMKTVHVNGMMCENCKKHVEKALNGIEGVSNVNVDLGKKIATLEVVDSSVTDETIKQAIIDAGYEVEKID